VAIQGEVRGRADVARHHRYNRLAPLMSAQPGGVGFTQPFPAGVCAEQRADGLYRLHAVEAIAQPHVGADTDPGGLLILKLL